LHLIFVSQPGLFSYNLFDGRYVNEVNLVGYADGWALGIGVREDGKTMAPSTPTYSASISQRTELDFEIDLQRTVLALAAVTIGYYYPEVMERLQEVAPAQ